MMRAVAILLLASLSACASAPGAGSAGTGPILGQGSVGRSTDARSTVFTQSLAYPVDQVWRALPAAYDSIKVPLNTLDAKTRTIGNDGFKIRQQLGRTPLSSYIDCGRTQIGPNADSYEVVLTVLTQVQPADNGTSKITTTFESSARPIAYSQEYSKCSSKGVLEAKIMDVVKGRLMR
jgi:hypothetical protein